MVAVLTIVIFVLMFLWYMHFHLMDEKLDRLRFDLRGARMRIESYQRMLQEIDADNRLTRQQEHKPELTVDDFWEELTN